MKDPSPRMGVACNLPFFNYPYRDEFKDRIESQKEIKLFLDDIFKYMGKDSFNFDDFSKLNSEFSSETFLSVRISPCKHNKLL